MSKRSIIVLISHHHKLLDHINILHGQNAEFYNIKVGGTYSNHCAFYFEDGDSRFF
jgi:hypothetical protein